MQIFRSSVFVRTPDVVDLISLEERLEDLRDHYKQLAHDSHETHCYSGASTWETFEDGKAHGKLEAIEEFLAELREEMKK